MARPILRAALAIASTAIAVAAVAHPSFADWRTEPVQLQVNGAACQQVAVCDDGGLGAIVIWEDRRSAYGGPLRCSHLLANGEFDPDWATADIVWDQDFNRADLRAHPDGAGGALVTWMEGTSLRLLHVRYGGEAPSASPTLLTVAADSGLPRIVPDGEGGLYIGWLVRSASFYRVLRVDEDGLASPGWPAGGRIFYFGLDGSGNPVKTLTGSIAPVPGGGVWVVYAGYGIDPEGLIVPGEVRLARLGASGAAVPGWSRQVAAFPAEAMPCAARAGAQEWELSSKPLVDVASDECGGVYVVRGAGVVRDPLDAPDQIVLLPTVHRFDALHQVAEGWPEAGVSPDRIFDDSVLRAWGGAGGPYRVWSLAGNRAGFGMTWPGGTSLPAYGAYRLDSDGACGNGFGGGVTTGMEFAHGPGGVVFVASFYPDGPRGPCDWQGYAECSGSDGTLFYRTRGEGQYTHYSDVGVAALSDGGAVFAWGESGTELNGLFAVRLGGAPPLDVPASAVESAPAFTLRFAPGAGIRASLALPGTGEARLLLADVTGRAVARETFALEAGAREWTLRGTASLAPGLYFARVTRGGESLDARVVVTR